MSDIQEELFEAVCIGWIKMSRGTLRACIRAAESMPHGQTEDGREQIEMMQEVLAAMPPPARLPVFKGSWRAT